MRRLLDERERKKEAGRRKTNRVISLILIVTGAVLIIGFFSSSSNRQVLSAAIDELFPASRQQTPGGPAAEPSQSTSNPAQAQQSGPNGSPDAPAGPLSTENMHFAGELLRFIKPAAPQPPPAPAGSAQH